MFDRFKIWFHFFKLYFSTCYVCWFCLTFLSGHYESSTTCTLWVITPHSSMFSTFTNSSGLPMCLCLSCPLCLHYHSLLFLPGDPFTQDPFASEDPFKDAFPVADNDSSAFPKVKASLSVTKRLIMLHLSARSHQWIFVNVVYKLFKWLFFFFFD